MTDVGGATNTYEVQSRNMINICTKYGFDSFIISVSYKGHRRHTTDNRRQTTDDGRLTTPEVCHKLPRDEVKICDAMQL